MVEMTVPENTPNMLKLQLWQAATTTIEVLKQPRGPVHLNFPLREPLLPDFTRTCIDPTKYRLPPLHSNRYP